MEEMEKAYWTHEVSKRLDIADSTLRKWCIELEENGYTFIKGVKNSRAFTDHDIIALTYFKSLTREKNHTMEQAAKTVAEKFSRKGANEGTTPVTMSETRSSNDLQEVIKELVERANEQEKVNKILLERTKKQEEFNKALLHKLEQQERYIKESIENRDRLLLESIRTSQEQAAASEKKKLKNRIKNLFTRKK